jgi:hypothetical protein
MLGDGRATTTMKIHDGSFDLRALVLLRSPHLAPKLPPPPLK